MTPEVEEFFNKFHDPRTGRFASGFSSYKGLRGRLKKAREKQATVNRGLAKHQDRVEKATAEVQKFMARTPGRMVALQFSMSERMIAFLNSLD